MTGWGTPHHDWTGYTPSIIMTGWDTPPAIRQSSIASTCYVVGSMHLALMQEDFLVSTILNCSEKLTRKSSCMNARGIPTAV